ncbi:MAG: hypothetical protein A2Z83_04905 [Omnitrophica bacterium GWA2_52_8]|nr:MAG: hypothetical protein A2Z83_04905 [Omnitrophica bacterium GWA2_52_8]
MIMSIRIFNQLKIAVIGMLTVLFLSGCIRIAGGAGVSHQGPADESPKTKSVGFDTRDILGSGDAPGSIET